MLLAVVVILLLVGGATAYVALPAVRDLRSARSALEGAAADLSRSDVSAASSYLESVHDRLDGPLAHVLGVVPVVGSSLDAMRAVAESARPVLESGLALKVALDRLRAQGLLDNGRIRVAALERLRPLVEKEANALLALERASRAHRNGWVGPPVWDALDELIGRAHDLRKDASALDRLLGVVNDLLGATGPRTYLVMLVNNAELRGGGGVLSGVGTITLRGGRMTLGSFFPYEALVRHPYRSVAAPEDYERRYGRYQANTTLWVNATYSPDVPDDAIVASRLYELVEHVHTDGAFVVDPRGLAALLPSDARVPVRGTDLELSPPEIPRFIYSDAYKLFDDNTERRAAILGVGEQAFQDVIQSGSADETTTDAAGAAFAAGHLRFVPFDASERAALDALGATGALDAPEDDGLLVAAQNFGGGDGNGTKLDYWAKRTVEHRCDVAVDGSAECATTVTLANDAPAGLTRYVAGRPYGLLRSYVETYVPQRASLESVTLDGDESDFYPQEDQGNTSVAVYAKVPRGSEGTISIRYSLPATEDHSFSFRALPQPLARDATLKLALAFPRDWSIDGPGTERDGVLDYSGPFVDELEVRAGPDQRTGIPGVWDSLADFWREPLF